MKLWPESSKNLWSDVLSFTGQMPTFLKKILLLPLRRSLHFCAQSSGHCPCLFERTVCFFPSVSPLFLPFHLHSHGLCLYSIINSTQYNTYIQHSVYCVVSRLWSWHLLIKEVNFSVRTYLTERNLLRTLHKSLLFCNSFSMLDLLFSAIVSSCVQHDRD